MDLGTTHLYPLKPDGWLITNPYPAGMGSHPESSSCEVDTEPALWTVGQTVAIPGLTVRHQSSLHLSGEFEVVGCE